MEYVEEIFTAWVTIFSLVLLIIAAISYKRTASKKMLYVGFVFGAFFVKGLFVTYLLFVGNSTISPSIVTGLFDVIILLLLYCVALKR
jgi:hypothetical protein